MRRHAAVLLLGLGALLLTPGAAGVPAPVPGDPTPPVVTPVITGTLGDAGWYTTNVTVNWSIVDPESIILSTSGCDTRTLAADTVATRLECTAVSDGGETIVAKVFKVDKSAPAASATPSRAADANGWYNHDVTVAFAGSDGTSGLQSCSPAQVYGGPDTPSTTVSGTCRDVAGNTAPATFPLKYDETAPQASPTARAPDANGWYNQAVTVTFQGADGTSGVQSCTQVTYAGPDDPSVALSGTCLDRAGNQSPSSGFTLKYDETAPQASATASRGADANGWYNHPLTVSFNGSDETSGLASCDAAKSYSGPDVASVSIGGSCRDVAGNVAPRSIAVKYDATAPQVTTTPGRAANANGWYSAPLSVTFAGTDAMSGLASCVGPQSYSGPDNAAAAISGNCSDQAGNVRNASFALKYDATAPQANASPGRSADANGWYNHSLAVSFAGTDSTSGIGSCDASKSYSTPDSASASLSGTCLDRAGNQSGAAVFGFKYDATPPQATATPSRVADTNGWYNHALTVSFAGTDATSTLDSCDAQKSYSGPDGASTSVSGACRDKAGNVGATSYAFKYDATAPVATASPSRAPNANGWFAAPLTVSFTGTDATSTIDSCDAQKSYSGPDTASTAVAGACRDKAGNASAASYVLKYDATAPVATASPSRAPNANGWFNAPLNVSFAGTDAMSTIDSCDAQKSYSGPDAVSTAVSGACRDKAGNLSAAASFGFKYDATAPVTTATPSRQPNANGWYRAPLSVTFSGGDATSTIDSCDAQKSYSGPDSASTALSGACRDKAGNSGSTSYPLKYDATAPTAAVTPSRQPNGNGWYNAPLTVTFAATDGLSGLGSCPAAQSYGGPDNASAVISGTCRDKADNGALASFLVRYDQTAPVTTALPSRQPNSKGWYNAALTVAFAATDAMSGPDSCTAAQAYSGPDSATVSRNGSCSDRAGNVSTGAFAFKYDATPPAVTNAVPTRAPDRAGWYNRPVAVAAQGNDATSGLDSCPSVTYTGPDANDAPIFGSCVDQAGNLGFKWFSVDYDATGPQVTASPSRGADANGWYNHALTVSFVGSDAVSGLESCAPPESYSGPDSASAVIGGICLDKAGNAGVGSFDLHYDGTPPQVTGATPNRPPDAGGWYNRPLVVTFHGGDVTSQVEACTQAAYAGPDTAGTSVTGSCRDRAGNASEGASFALRFDGSAPSLTDVRAKAGNGKVELTWAASPDTTLVEIRRADKLVYSGADKGFTDTRLQNGVQHRYALKAYDEALNAVTREVTARPTAPLSPAPGATVTAPPRLAWTAVAKATSYQVQVWRRGRIFSAWPKATSIQLRRSWTYRGRRYKLTPGRYRWYVWPRYAKKFGPLLGSSSFLVKRR